MPWICGKYPWKTSPEGQNYPDAMFLKFDFSCIMRRNRSPEGTYSDVRDANVQISETECHFLGRGVTWSHVFTHEREATRSRARWRTFSKVPMVSTEEEPCQRQWIPTATMGHKESCGSSCELPRRWWSTTNLPFSDRKKMTVSQRILVASKNFKHKVVLLFTVRLTSLVLGRSSVVLVMKDVRKGPVARRSPSSTEKCV